MERININEWLYYYFCKREDALPVLINYFRPMIVQLMKDKYESFNRDDYTLDDNLSKADTLLVECIEKYHYGYNTSFITYYRQCFINVIYSTLRSKYREQKLYKYDMVYGLKLGEESITYIADSYPSKLGVHDYVLKKIDMEQKFDKLVVGLNDLELKILNLKRLGYNSVQISKMLGLKPKQVQYRINKMKKSICFD